MTWLIVFGKRSDADDDGLVANVNDPRGVFIVLKDYVCRAHPSGCRKDIRSRYCHPERGGMHGDIGGRPAEVLAVSEHVPQNFARAYDDRRALSFEQGIG